MKPCQLDWQKLVILKKIYPVEEKTSYFIAGITFSSVLKKLTAVSESLAYLQNNISAIEKIICYKFQFKIKSNLYF